jgi:hypothetical protein
VLGVRGEMTCSGTASTTVYPVGGATSIWNACGRDLS